LLILLLVLTSQSTPTKPNSDDIAPPLPVKSRNSLIMIDDGAPPLPVKQDSRSNKNSTSRDDNPPAVPNKNSQVVDDLPPLPVKQDGSVSSKPRPFRER